MKTVAVVGASGFIGGHLASRYKNVQKFGRENISNLAYDKSGLTIIAAAPAAKWVANSDPQADLLNIQNLVESLKCIEDRKSVLISTIDVFPVKCEFDETSPLPAEHPEAYGANRGYLESELRKYLSNLHIIRLPGMFGPGLKKNLIFDLMNGKDVPSLNSSSSFQFYDVRLLPSHIELSLAFNLKILNLATEPISVSEIYNHCFDSTAKDFDVPSIEYRMITKYGHEVAGRGNNYLISKKEVLAGIRQWIDSSGE
jgi:nucleoside-diphosphate-sugar epimerase